MNATATLLVVDDERINLDIISEHLDELHYDIVQATSGSEALALLLSAPGKFDLLLLDHMMPGMEGLTLLAAIREDERFSSMAVVMQTAAAGPDQIARGLELGACYYLTKPYHGSALRNVIRAALRDTNETRELQGRLRSFSGAMPLLISGHFEARTLDDVHHLAVSLASLCPKSELAVIGLTELLVNAVEHGNLGITYAEKSDLKKEDRWEHEVARRLALEEHLHKKVDVQFERSQDRLRFVITDQGNGFDFEPYLTLSATRAFDLHRWGIAMARRLSFSDLEFQHGGNRVVASIATV